MQFANNIQITIAPITVLNRILGLVFHPYKQVGSNFMTTII